VNKNTESTKTHTSHSRCHSYQCTTNIPTTNLPNKTLSSKSTDSTPSPSPPSNPQSPLPRTHPQTPHDVTGKILISITYRLQANHYPNDDPSFLSKELFGHIAEADIDKIDEVCRGIKPPDKQVNMQGRRLDQGVGAGSELLSSKIACLRQRQAKLP